MNDLEFLTITDLTSGKRWDGEYVLDLSKGEVLVLKEGAQRFIESMSGSVDVDTVKIAYDFKYDHKMFLSKSRVYSGREIIALISLLNYTVFRDRNRDRDRS